VSGENGLPYVNINGGVVVKRTQVHSAPISGTYRLKVNNQAISIWGGASFNITDIPYNTYSWQI